MSSAERRATGNPLHFSGPSGANPPITACPPPVPPALPGLHSDRVDIVSEEVEDSAIVP